GTAGNRRALHPARRQPFGGQQCDAALSATGRSLEPAVRRDGSGETHRHHPRDHLGTKSPVGAGPTARKSEGAFGGGREPLKLVFRESWGGHGHIPGRCDDSSLGLAKVASVLTALTWMLK